MSGLDACESFFRDYQRERREENILDVGISLEFALDQNIPVQINKMIRKEFWNFIGDSMLIECSTFLNDVKKMNENDNVLVAWIGNLSHELRLDAALNTNSPKLVDIGYLNSLKEQVKNNEEEDGDNVVISMEGIEYKFFKTYNIVVLFRLVLINGFNKVLNQMKGFYEDKKIKDLIFKTPTFLSLLFDVDNPCSIYDLILIPIIKNSGVTFPYTEELCQFVYFSYFFLAKNDPNGPANILQSFNDKSFNSMMIPMMDALVLKKLRKIKRFPTYIDYGIIGKQFKMNSTEWTINQDFKQYVWRNESGSNSMITDTFFSEILLNDRNNPSTGRSPLLLASISRAKGVFPFKQGCLPLVISEDPMILFSFLYCLDPLNRDTELDEQIKRNLILERACDIDEKKVVRVYPFKIRVFNRIISMKPTNTEEEDNDF